MDERIRQNVSKDIDDFSSADKRQDFWKARIVRQTVPATKVYLFPSLLEWLNGRPQLILNAALGKKEEQLELKPREGSGETTEHQNITGDPLALYVAGHTKHKPSAQDIDSHLQRSYAELCKRREQGRFHELVSLIDACILLNETTFAWKISQENNYEHDLLQICRRKAGKDKWDDYKTTVMLQLSSGGTPSKELWEAATATRLLCDIMAGPTSRRRSALAEMAANGLKLDALVLAKLHFSDDVLCEELVRECSQLFQKTISADINEMVGLINDASTPFFERRMLRCIDQLSCYRILRIDFILNENAALEKKLIGRIELAEHVRFVIADALIHRNFGAVKFIAENAPAHLDKYSFFSGLEQIVYPMAMSLLLETTRIVFHAKSVFVGCKNQNDEYDKLGAVLQQHPNGYIGGLVEMWLKRAPLNQIASCRDVYRQRSLRTSVESIASVLREDTTFNPMCRGLLIFACDLVCNVLEAIFGRPCHRLDELIENKYIDHHTGISLIRKLSKGILSSHANERVVHILDQLCAISFSDSLDSSSQDNLAREVELHSEAALKVENESYTGVMDFELANIPFLVESGGNTMTEMSGPTNSMEKTSGDRMLVEDGFVDTGLIKSVKNDGEHLDLRPGQYARGQEGDVATVSEQSSDQNDVSSVAPSRSVCEQVETMLAGVKYCKEREMEVKKRVKDVEDEQQQNKDVVSANISYVLAMEEIKQSEWRPRDSGNTSERMSYDNLCSASQAPHSEEEQLLKTKGAPVDDDDEKQAPITTVEPIDNAGSTRIISDDHLDFSSHDPSLRTKWLPDDGIPDENMADSAVKAPVSPHKDGFKMNAFDFNVVDDAVEGSKDVLRKDEAVDGHQENEVIAELSDCVTRLKAEVGPQVNPPSSPVVSPNQWSDDTRPLRSHANRDGKIDEQRIDVSEHAEEASSQIMFECVDPPYEAVRSVSNLEQGPALQNTILSAQPAVRNLVDLDVSHLKERNPFPSTREMVFCTSSVMSDNNLSTTSTDDDIAGLDRSSLKTEPPKQQILPTKQYEANLCSVSSDIAVVPQPEDVHVGNSKPIETADSEACDSGRGGIASSHETVIVDGENGAPDYVLKNIRDGCSATSDSDNRQSVLRPVQKKEIQGMKEIVGHSKPVPVQRKFLSGGFDSGSSSGFGGFAGGHFEKENTFGSSSSTGGRREGFDCERNSHGGGRCGFRGGGRGGRGYERDRDPLRDEYRDKDRRERHDSFRGRSGGYGRSDSRDSQSFEGRGGYHGNRA